MTLYLLNEDVNHRATEVIEGYESYIWADRFNTEGDVEITYSVNYLNSPLIQIGSLIVHSRSFAVCRIYKYSISMDSDNPTVTYYGVDLKKVILGNQPNRNTVPKTYRWSNPANPKETTSYEDRPDGTEIRRNFFENPLFLKAKPSDTNPWQFTTNNCEIEKTDDGLVISPTSDTSANSYVDYDISNKINNSYVGQTIVIDVVMSKSGPQIGTLITNNFQFSIYVNSGSIPNLRPIDRNQPNVAHDHHRFRMIYTIPAGISSAILRLINGARANGGDVTVNSILMCRASTEKRAIELADMGYFDGLSNWYQLNPTRKIKAKPHEIAYQLLNRPDDEEYSPLEDGKYGSTIVAPLDWGSTTTSSIFPAYSSKESDGPVTYDDEKEVELEFSTGSRYDSLEDICGDMGYGFAVLRNPANGYLYKMVYSGLDRTINQQKFPAVVFDQSLGNITDMSEASTDEEAKNLALVYGANEAIFVDQFGQVGADSDYEGFDRTILIVDATGDDDPDNPKETSRQILTTAGVSALRGSTPKKYIDGEADNTNGMYTYGIDYGLGSKVTLVNPYGLVTDATVVEYIISEDSEGYKEYPTFEISDAATRDTWKGYPPTINWEDETTDKWEDK